MRNIILFPSRKTIPCYLVVALFHLYWWPQAVVHKSYLRNIELHISNYAPLCFPMINQSAPISSVADSGCDDSRGGMTSGELLQVYNHIATD
jgi:hypothetical protein